MTSTPRIREATTPEFPWKHQPRAFEMRLDGR